MNSLIRLFVVALVVSSPAVVFASSPSEVLEAKNQVKQYRALRRACSITKGDQRKACFSQLNAATENYKKAKRFLATQTLQPKSTESESTLIGQAQ